MDIINGRTWIFGENIDTDVIIPGRYLRTFNPKDLAEHVLEGERPDFTKNVKQGDIIVADENFGCGSSREQAPVAITDQGVSTATPQRNSPRRFVIHRVYLSAAAGI